MLGMEEDSSLLVQYLRRGDTEDEGHEKAFRFQAALLIGLGRKWDRLLGRGQVWGMKMFHIVQKRSQTKGNYYCVYDGGRLVFMTTVLKQANRWLRLNPDFVSAQSKPAPAPVKETRVA